MLELDRNFAYGHLYLSDCYLAQSNYVAAIGEYRTSDLLSGLDPARVAEIYGALRQAYQTRGEQGCLRKWTELLLADEALPADKQMLADHSSTDLAGYYARLGEKERHSTNLKNVSMSQMSGRRSRFCRCMTACMTSHASKPWSSARA